MRHFNRLSIFWLMFILNSQPKFIESLSNGTVAKVSSEYLGASRFDHLAIHRDDGTVFISALNRLYKLSPDLVLLANVTTCNISNPQNYNKILVVDYEMSQLIICGTSEICPCSAYNFRIDPNKLIFNTSNTENILPNRLNTSTVAFTSLYMENSNTDRFQKLVVAVSNDVNANSPPAIKVRTLDPANFLHLVHSDSDYNLKTPVAHFSSSYYRVKFVYGFNSEKYNYFLITKRNSSAEESVYVSKLIRICDNGNSLSQGYTEILIECKFHNDQLYNLIQAATVGKPNSELAKSLHIGSGDDVLFTIFSKSEDTGAPSNEISNHSALCIYSLKAINEKFTENIRDCFKGIGNRGFGSISDQRCKEIDETINSNFCTSASVNMPLHGDQNITESPVITFNAHVTAIASKMNENYNEVFIGSNRGHLKNIIVNNSSRACELIDLPIDEGSPVNSDLLFSPTNDSLYIMTAHNLTRIKIPISLENCSKNENFSACIQSTANNCGWCELSNKCTTECECTNKIYSSWYRNNIKIVAHYSDKYHVNPGETLQLHITDLPSINDTFHCAFFFNNETFQTNATVLKKSVGLNVSCLTPGINEISRISFIGEHQNIKLSILSEHIGEIASTNITFSQCFAYNSCDTCVSAKKLQCRWDLINKVCLYDPKTIADDKSCESNQTNYTSTSHSLDPVVHHIFIAVTIVMLVILTIALIMILFHCIVYKKTSENQQKIDNLQHQINVMGLEAIATKQCIKRVIIENRVCLDENSSKILKLPYVEIQQTSISEVRCRRSLESEYVLPRDDKWEFPKCDLTLGRYLGQGEFGKVVQGEARNILEENITTTVAVKMLKDNHTDEDMIDLVSEMEIMKSIGAHVNVLRLLGCCSKDGKLFVITEYAKRGNLREFLQKHLPSDNEITEIILSPKKLTFFAVQVARGMEHLASIQCVHRDLAARNILVSENYILKIADFGLARDISNKQYYRKRTDGRLPVKWMAPESLSCGIYSTQSDVWSYGILLWEIFTFGSAPYASLLNVEYLYQVLESGYRMEKPHYCCDEIYNVMHKCWSFQSSDRPSFSTILKKLKDILLNHE